MSDRPLLEDYEEEQVEAEEEIVFSPSPLPPSEQFRIARMANFSLLPSSKHKIHSTITNNVPDMDDCRREIGGEEEESGAYANGALFVNVQAAGNSVVVQHGWSFEHFVVFAMAMLSATLFVYLPTDSFNAKLDFHFLFSNLLFYLSFLTRITFSRREDSALRICKIKDLLCEIELALLMWNRNAERPNEEFEPMVCSILVELAQCFFRMLELPTQPEEWMGQNHQRIAIRKRTQQLREQLTGRFMMLHYCLFDCKMSKALKSSDSHQVGKYIKDLHVLMEQVQMLKQYRSPQAARQFVICHLLICPPLWGAYFANIAEQSGTPFALALAAISVSVALVLTVMVRSSEDPFLSTSHETVNLHAEFSDAVDRLKLVKKFCSQKAQHRQVRL